MSTTRTCPNCGEDLTWEKGGIADSDGPNFRTYPAGWGCTGCGYHDDGNGNETCPQPPRVKKGRCDQQGIEPRGTARLMADIAAAPAVYEGMPAGDFDGIDPTGKTPRMPTENAHVDPTMAKILNAWRTVNRIAAQAKCSCDPTKPKWARGYRDSGGFLTCARCDGRIY